MQVSSSAEVPVRATRGTLRKDRSSDNEELSMSNHLDNTGTSTEGKVHETKNPTEQSISAEAAHKGAQINSGHECNVKKMQAHTAKRSPVQEC